MVRVCPDHCGQGAEIRIRVASLLGLTPTYLPEGRALRRRTGDPALGETSVAGCQVSRVGWAAPAEFGTTGSALL